MVLKMDKEVTLSKMNKPVFNKIHNNVLFKSILLNIILFIDFLMFYLGRLFSEIFYHEYDVKVTFSGIMVLSFLINCLLAFIIPIVCYNIYKHMQKCEIQKPKITYLYISLWISMIYWLTSLFCLLILISILIFGIKTGPS